MNIISSPHEKRYRKGASLNPSEFLYLHRHIFSRVYCTVTGGDSLGTLTPPHSARGTQNGDLWDQWVLGYPSVWDGVGKGSGPIGAGAGPQELVARHRRASEPTPSWLLGSSEGPSPAWGASCVGPTRARSRATRGAQALPSPGPQHHRPGSALGGRCWFGA